MSMRYYISTEEASFFINNRMGYANSIPTSGTYKVGDFIISSTQEDGIFGWVCTVAGTPGEWEVIGSGMNDGSGMHDKVVGYMNAVSFSDTRSSVEIGIDEYEKGKDFLEVHYNGLMLAEGVHYNVSEDGKSIIAIDEVWNENADDTQQMIFRVIKSEGVNVKELKNTINIDSACYEVEMGIEGFNPEKDVVEVHLNGVLLVQGVDYEIIEGRISKLDSSEAWNPYNVNGQKMFVRVFRNIANLIEPEDGSVTMEKLSPDVRSDVAAIDGLVSSMSIQNSTISNLNDRVTAIEEKIESGDIVTNGSGGGPVKLTYKDNLVEVVNTNTVAIGLPFNKEKDMLEVHIDGLKLAEGVHYNISEDGLSIVKVDGVWNPDSLEDQYIDFRVITAGNEQIEHLTNNIEFSSSMTEVEIGLEYEHGVDILIVHLNGIKLVEGLDFNFVVEGNKIVKIDANEPWNLYGVDGQLFVIDVLRNVGEKVTMDDLADDVKGAIENANNIDLSGYQTSNAEGLNTNDKTIVGAINELFQNANNGKQIIADAIGSPLSSDDTFAAMGNSINNMTIDFRNALALKGVNAPADKLEALIGRIDDIIQSGNVLNNQVMVSGEYTIGTTLTDNSSPLIIQTNHNFIPDYFLVVFPYNSLKSTNYPSDTVRPQYPYLCTDTMSIKTNSSRGTDNTISLSYNDISFTLTMTDDGSISYSSIPSGTKIKWYAIGSSQLPNNGGERTITPSTSDQVLPDGYYSGDITVKGDSDLLPENIVAGKEIFGVTGSAKTADDIFLYKEGDMAESGGWIGENSNGTLTLNNTDMTMFLSKGGGTWSTYQFIVNTNNSVDFTNYTRLIVEIESASATYGSCSVKVTGTSNDKSLSIVSGSSSASTINARTALILDISDVTGTGKVQLYMSEASTTNSRRINVVFKRIKLEK